MKRLNSFLFAGFITCTFVACDQFENIRQYTDEIVYPGRFDTIYYHLGYERVEIDLMKDGRLPAGKMNLGKAKKTVIEYDDQRIVIDSLCSWLNVTGLTEKRLYRFKIYTIDEYDDQSVPMRMSVIPYTSFDRDLLDVSQPRLITKLDGSVIIDWPAGLDSQIAAFSNFSYSYRNKDGNDSIRGIITRDDPQRLDIEFVPQTNNGINISYRLVPILTWDPEPGRRVYLIDTIVFKKNIDVRTPSANDYFTPTEYVALRSNNMIFQYGEAFNVKKLTLPMHINTFSDLSYFPNLEELDLTGAGLLNVTPNVILSGNGAINQFGSANYYPYMQRIEYTDIFPLRKPIDTKEALLELIKSGVLKKITYIENSLSLESDPDFKPYFDNGSVFEYVDDSWYPEELPLDSRLVHEGRPAAAAFECDVTFPVSPPHPEEIIDPGMVFRIAPIMKNMTWAFTLPKEYRYDFERYRYLKFSVYMTAPDQVVTQIIANNMWGAYRQIWPRIRYSFWACDQINNPYGAGDTWEWRPSQNTYTVPAANINNSWTHFTIDLKSASDKIMGQNHSTDPADKHQHFRNICFSLGAEQGPANAGSNPNAYTPPIGSTTPLVYYFADVRLSQKP